MGSCNYWPSSCLFQSMFGMDDGTRFLLLLFVLSSSSLCFGSELDIQCLMSLKQSVVDPDHVLVSTWNFGNDKGAYICKFTGVECWHPDENRVLSLRLSNFGLEGPFPQGLQNCTSMTALDLSSNKFSGPIPSDIAQQLPSLTSLDLSYNNFSGEIPGNISNMRYLNNLNLQHNQLSGQIPSQFSALDRLITFSVADNLLKGPIPNFDQKFPSLSFEGNKGLCGAPLDRCRRRLKIRIRPYEITDESWIGAAIGFVTGFVVAFYFWHYFVCSKRLRTYVVRV